MLTFNLNEQGNSFSLSDFGANYVYNRVKDPDGNNTQYYNFFFKPKGVTSWHTVNGVLSQEFTVCSTEAVLQQIKDVLNSEVVYEKMYSESHSIKSILVLKDFQLPSMEITDADKVIFKLLTYIDVDDFQNNTQLAFNIINGFAGNVALQLNYGFVTNFESKTTVNGKRPSLRISNLFILDEFAYRLIHDQKLSINYEQVQNVKNNVNSRIELYKSITPDKEFMDGLSSVLPKKFLKNFLGIYDAIPNEFRNLYYITMIFSSILEESSSIYKEISARKFISDYVKSKGISK